MSTSGVVLSVDVEQYGATLTTATTAADLVLQVDDIVDFADEDDFAAGPQWLKVGDSAPMQYVSVDDDNDTVTLAAAIGAIYEAGEPVRMWDAAADAEVVSHVAWVELDEADSDDQPIPAEVTHDRMIFFGLDNMAGLIGARVSLVEDEDDPDAWLIEQVLGRRIDIDPGFVANPFLSMYLTADQAIPNAADVGVGATPATWTIRGNRGFTNLDPDGWVRINKSGFYMITGTAFFDANSTGSRDLRIMTKDWAGVPSLRRRITTAASGGWATSFQAIRTMHITEGYWVRLEVRQSSGATLSLRGGSEDETAIEISWVSS